MWCCKGYFIHLYYIESPFFLATSTKNSILQFHIHIYIYTSQPRGDRKFLGDISIRTYSWNLLEILSSFSKSQHFAPPGHPQGLSLHKWIWFSYGSIELWSCLNFSFGSQSFWAHDFSHLATQYQAYNSHIGRYPSSTPTSPQTTSSKSCPLGHDPLVRLEDVNVPRKHPGGSTEALPHSRSFFRGKRCWIIQLQAAFPQTHLKISLNISELQLELHDSTNGRMVIGDTLWRGPKKSPIGQKALPFLRLVVSPQSIRPIV